MTVGIRLIASDLDGTLLRSDGSLSERSRRALRAARAAGLEFVPISGRPPRGVVPFGFAEVADAALCANGALVYDLVADRLLEELHIAPAAVRHIVADLRQAAPGVVFACEAGLTFCREPAWEITHPLDSVDPITEDATAFAARPVAKLLVRHPEVQQKLLIPIAEAVAGDQAIVTRTGPEVLEIGPAGVTKATALAVHCRRRDVDPSAVLAFGDMVNDVAMLQWAGRAVAVANAHPDVLAGADEVTGTNDEDGVAVYLERLLV